MFATVRRWLKGKLGLERQQQELDALYRLLYQVIHDLDESPNLSAVQTEAAFARQWEKLPTGNYLLSDPWFKENVARIIWEEELQIRPEWFRGKRVLDAGCGNGRWSYGLAQLGANLTAVDVNAVAIDATRAALAGQDAVFHICPLERLGELLREPFDLVWCWGVLHHCRSFTRSMDALCKLVKPDGLLYLYLYGRENLPYEVEFALFKERIRYNTLPTDEAKHEFLLAKAGGNESAVHNYHDAYAPLLNRILDWPSVEKMLRDRGFPHLTRTIMLPDLFVRAMRTDEGIPVLPPKKPPYWIQHHDRKE